MTGGGEAGSEPAAGGGQGLSNQPGAPGQEEGGPGYSTRGTLRTFQAARPSRRSCYGNTCSLKVPEAS